VVVSFYIGVYTYIIWGYTPILSGGIHLYYLGKFTYTIWVNLPIMSKINKSIFWPVTWRIQRDLLWWGICRSRQNWLFRIKAGGMPYWRWRLGLSSLAVHDLKHTMSEVFELIIIEVYGSTVFGVVVRLFFLHCFNFVYVGKY
jgi:hypothetical protein